MPSSITKIFLKKTQESNIIHVPHMYGQFMILLKQEDFCQFQCPGPSAVLTVVGTCGPLLGKIHCSHRWIQGSSPSNKYGKEPPLKNKNSSKTIQISPLTSSHRKSIHNSQKNCTVKPNFLFSPMVLIFFKNSPSQKICTEILFPPRYFVYSSFLTESLVAH